MSNSLDKIYIQNLQIYIIYIFLLGQNNVLDTFVTNYLEINKTKNNIFNTIRILIYLSICIIFEFKIFGLIIANISYLLINIYKNLHFIRINML